MFPEPFKAAELLDAVKEVLAEHPPRKRTARNSG